jgi:YfiR/HmsC-like
VKRAFLVVMALLAGTPWINGESAQEYVVKAAFLYNLAKFVEWPDTQAKAPLYFGILGQDPFGDTLDRTVNNKLIGGRPVMIKRSAELAGLADCQVVFVSSSETKRLKQILKTLEGRPVLTVGDTEGFVQSGGETALVLEQNRVVLEVNTDQTAKAGLRISSRALEVARIVHNP